MYALNNKIALLTKHEKEVQIAPVFARHWPGDIEVNSTFDTDTLGSFDNTVARTLSPIECALKKANLACELTGLSQGLGSEGSFTGYAGIGNMNEEFLAFVDRATGIEVIGVYRQMTPLAPVIANDEIELKTTLSQYSNKQGWMLVENSGESEHIIEKGLIGIKQITYAAGHKFPISITPDFRAMMCPERQKNIAKTAENLLEKLCSPCPNCNSPGFVFDQAEQGLPCELCGAPTNQVLYRSAVCKQCGHTEKQQVTETTASSYYCNICNP